LDFGVGNQFSAGSKGNPVGARPIFELRKVGREDDSSELALVTDDRGSPHQGVELERILDGLRRDEFPARGFDEIFLAVGDREISIGVDVPYVAGLEPAVDKSVLIFLRPIPVALDYRWASHLNLPIFSDAHFEIRQ